MSVLRPWDGFDVPGVDERQLEAVLQHRPDRLPVHAGGLHRDLPHPERLHPVTQRQEPSHGRFELRDLLDQVPVGPDSDACRDAGLVHVKRARALNDPFHLCLLCSITEIAVRRSLAFSSDAVARALMATVRGSGTGSYALLSRGLVGTKEQHGVGARPRHHRPQGPKRPPTQPRFQNPAGGRQAMTTFTNLEASRPADPSPMSCCSTSAINGSGSSLLMAARATM